MITEIKINMVLYFKKIWFMQIDQIFVRIRKCRHTAICQMWRPRCTNQLGICFIYNLYIVYICIILGRNMNRMCTSLNELIYHNVRILCIMYHVYDSLWCIAPRIGRMALFRCWNNPKGVVAWSHSKAQQSKNGAYNSWGVLLSVA